MSRSSQAPTKRPTCVSLGWVVLDELRYVDRPTLYNVPGGPTHLVGSTLLYAHALSHVVQPPSVRALPYPLAVRKM